MNRFSIPAAGDSRASVTVQTFAAQHPVGLPAVGIQQHRVGVDLHIVARSRVAEVLRAPIEREHRVGLKQVGVGGDPRLQALVVEAGDHVPVAIEHRWEGG